MNPKINVVIVDGCIQMTKETKENS